MKMVALMTVCMLLSCHPSLPPVAGCTPFAHSCSPEGMTLVCSASLRWEPEGDVSCTATGQRCVVDTTGRAHCALAVDADDAGADGGDQ